MYVLNAKYIADVPRQSDGVLSLFIDQLPQAKHILQVGGGYVLISDNAKDVISRYSVCPSVIWTRMRIVLGNASTVDYFSIKGNQIEIVDRRRSEIRWIVEKRVIGEVKRWKFLFELP